MSTDRSLIIITAPLGGNKAFIVLFCFPETEAINPKNWFPGFSFPVDGRKGSLAELQDEQVLSETFSWTSRWDFGR